MAEPVNTNRLHFGYIEYAELKKKVWNLFYGGTGMLPRLPCPKSGPAFSKRKLFWFFVLDNRFWSFLNNKPKLKKYILIVESTFAAYPNQAQLLL